MKQCIAVLIDLSIENFIGFCFAMLSYYTSLAKSRRTVTLWLYHMVVDRRFITLHGIIAALLSAFYSWARRRHIFPDMCIEFSLIWNLFELLTANTILLWYFNWLFNLINLLWTFNIISEFQYKFQSTLIRVHF